MPDRTLTFLVIAVIALSAAHDLDHLARDDFSQPLQWKIAATFLTVKYGLTCAALYYFSRGRIGTAFWAVIGAAGAAILWLAHLSPGAAQKPADIAAMYGNSPAGVAAAFIVYAMLASLLTLATYGGWLTAKRGQSSG